MNELLAMVAYFLSGPSRRNLLPDIRWLKLWHQGASEKDFHSPEPHRQPLLPSSIAIRMSSKLEVVGYRTIRALPGFAAVSAALRHSLISGL